MARTDVIAASIEAIGTGGRGGGSREDLLGGRLVVDGSRSTENLETGDFDFLPDWFLETPLEPLEASLDDARDAG